MPSLFTEDTYEQAIIELFENMGYEHLYAPDYDRDYTSPLLDSVLRDSLVRINRGLPLDAIEEAIAKLKNFDTGSLLQKNITFMDYLQNGITVKFFVKGEEQSSIVRLVDYEKEKNNRMMVEILSQIVEFRNGESGSHVLNINILTGMILESLVQKTDKYNITWSERLLITTASALHDIGKIGIDDKILNKPGKLTDEEFKIMQNHTIIGARILKNMEGYEDEELMMVAYQICR